MKNEEIRAVYSALRIFYPDFEQAAKWMTSPHKLLGNRRPVDCRYDEVMMLMEQFESGAFI
jgi:uncharacterized protein (DUF2384 family)